MCFNIPSLFKSLSSERLMSTRSWLPHGDSLSNWSIHMWNLYHHTNIFRTILYSSDQNDQLHVLQNNWSQLFQFQADDKIIIHHSHTHTHRETYIYIHTHIQTYIGLRDGDFSPTAIELGLSTQKLGQ